MMELFIIDFTIEDVMQLKSVIYWDQISAKLQIS